MTAIETTTANAGRHASRSTRSSRRDDRRATLWADGIGTASVGGLVIGGDYQGLGIARSLGRLGLPVCVVDDEHSVSRFSRYVGLSARVPDLKDEQRAVDALLTVGRRLGLEGWVLFPTRDETVAALSRHRDVLAEFFRVPTPRWSAVQWAWDKRNTYTLAERLGIPIPRTWYPRNLAGLRDIDAPPPYVIKPAVKEHFVYATKDKAWRADSRAELERLFTSALQVVPPDEVMVQELIPGGGRQQFAYCAFFKDGRAVGQMVVRRGRQHPPEFGRSSTFVETVDVPELVAPSERFLREIEYYGLVELEYKLDPNDGRYKLLDVNARTWGYHSIGWRAGVDFPALLFADQTGGSVRTCRARAGVRWVRLATDVPTAAVMLLDGQLDWRSYLRSLRGFDVEGSFARDDPLPGLVELAMIPYLAMKRGF